MYLIIKSTSIYFTIKYKMLYFKNNLITKILKLSHVQLNLVKNQKGRSFKGIGFLLDGSN